MITIMITITMTVMMMMMRMRMMMLMMMMIMMIMMMEHAIFRGGVDSIPPDPLERRCAVAAIRHACNMTMTMMMTRRSR